MFPEFNPMRYADVAGRMPVDNPLVERYRRANAGLANPPRIGRRIRRNYD